MRCGALGADIRYLGQRRLSTPRDRSGPRRRRDALDSVAIRGDVSSQFLSALLMALPMLAGAARRRSPSRSPASSISKPYVAITTNLMGRFGVAVAQDGWRRVRGSAQAPLREPRDDPRRGRRVGGVVLSRRGSDRRRPGARHRGRARIRSRATSRSPTCWRGWVPTSAAVTTGSRHGRTSARRHDHRLRRDSRRGDDARGRRAVRAGADDAARHRAAGG